jgi:hypothetical protein
LPFKTGEADAVYHAHLLEHLPRRDSVPFLEECYRILRPGGVIRVVVPDLRKLAKQYLDDLDAVLADPAEETVLRYEWSVIHLIDQMTRDVSGGEMLSYLARHGRKVSMIVAERWGEEGSNVLEKIENPVRHRLTRSGLLAVGNGNTVLNGIRRLSKGVKRLLRGSNSLTGEKHLWMYDRYSLQSALRTAGFTDMKSVDCHTSSIDGWDEYGLDLDARGLERRPDSLYLEALKAV